MQLESSYRVNIVSSCQEVDDVFLSCDTYTEVGVVPDVKSKLVKHDD